MADLLLDAKPQKKTTTAKLDVGLDLKLRRRVEKYLTPDLRTAVAAVPIPVRALKDVIQHLVSLYHTIGSYLPEHLRAPGTPYEGGRLWEGTFLSSDVSGFTALFEKLSVLGDEGAELLTQKMNDYFYVMLDILSRSNGIMMKFAGDALLAFFPRPERKARNPLANLLGDQEDEASQSQPSDDVFWAVRAALRMQRAMKPFHHFATSVGPGSLTMRVGLSSGALFAAHVGSHAQRDYMILGDLTAKAMATESAGNAGEVIIDRSAKALIGDAFRTTEIAPDLFKVVDDLGDELGDFEASQQTGRSRRGSRYTTFDSDPFEDLQETLQRVETLSAFLPTDLLTLLVESGDKRAIGSMNRPKTAVIFTHVAGPTELMVAWGKDELPRIVNMLDRYYTAMQRAIARFGGSLTRTDPYKTGDKLLATFGAPIKHYDDAERAVSAALAMNDELTMLNAHLAQTLAPELRERAPDPDVFLSHRIGVTLGDVLGTEVGVGRTGYGTRREYTVMGDDVNLAARLMSKAEIGTILVNDKIWQDVSYRFEGQTLEPIRVKGKQEPVQVYTITGEREHIIPQLDTDTPFIGRDTQRQAILEAAEAAIQGERGGHVFAVAGETGVGKSRLLYEIAETLRNRPVAVCHTTCVAYVSFYRPWVTIVSQLLGLTDLPEGERLARVRAALGELNAPHILLPLVNLLGLPRDELTEAEHGATMDVPEAIVELLRAASAQRPVILVIDDVHHADVASKRTMQAVREAIAEMPVFVLVAVQPDLFEGNASELTDAVIALEDLPEKQTVQVAQAMLDAEEIQPDLEKLIWRHSQGRPLFIEVLVRGLQRYKSVRVTPKRRVAKLTDEAEPDIMPSTTRAMVLSRIDRLPVAPREALLAAAVLGETFTVEALTHIHEDDDLTDVEYLTNEGLVAANRLVKGRYRFNSALTQVVAYHSLPNSRRRELHEAAGDYWTNFDNPSLMQLTERAYHHARCDDPFKAVESLRLARDRARGHGAKEQAISLCRQILDHARVVPELIGAYQEAAETLGDLYAEQEMYVQATAAYEPAVQEMYKAYMSVLCRQALVTLASDPIIAAMSLTRALTLADKAAPVRPWLQAALAWLLWRRGAYEAAAEYCRFDAGPPDAPPGDQAAPMLDYVYGLVLLGQGDQETGHAHLQGALDAWEVREYAEGVKLAQDALEGQAPNRSEAAGDTRFLRVLLALYFELDV